MSMSFAIRTEGLGKRYDINRGGNTHRSLRDLLKSVVRSGSGKFRTIEEGFEKATEVCQESNRELWALKDVAFEIAEGERVGVIGANGAGKSTLLKILSRVTTPTEGGIEIRGKVASLLEVGTGFHPDMTGKENIFLNGAILGMTSREIRRKFDQIVDFSGVGNFIDTPVKHYSSGMYVRLAFAVSAWLDPDILIVDEVLAVGDAAFQKKCAARMKELTKEGRTVLFVSHSMSSVNQMCQKALYLEKGRVVAFKSVEEATVEYQRDVMESTEGRSWHSAEFSNTDPKVELYAERKGEVVCLGGSIETEDGICSAHLPIERSIHVKVRYRVLKDLPFALVPNFHFYDETGARVFTSMPEELPVSTAGDYCATCVVPPFQLNNGRYYVNPANQQLFTTTFGSFCCRSSAALRGRREFAGRPTPTWLEPSASRHVAPQAHLVEPAIKQLSSMVTASLRFARFSEQCQFGAEVVRSVRDKASKLRRQDLKLFRAIGNAVPQQLPASGDEHRAIVAVEDCRLEGAVFDLRRGIGRNSMGLAKRARHEESVPPGSGDQRIALLPAQPGEGCERAAAVDAGIVVLDVDDMSRNRRVKFDYAQRGQVGFDRMPDVIVAAVDIDRKHPNVIRCADPVENRRRACSRRSRRQSY